MTMDNDTRTRVGAYRPTVFDALLGDQLPEYRDWLIVRSQHTRPDMANLKARGWEAIRIRHWTTTFWLVIRPPGDPQPPPPE